MRSSASDSVLRGADTVTDGANGVVVMREAGTIAGVGICTVTDGVVMRLAGTVAGVCDVGACALTSDA